MFWLNDLVHDVEYWSPCIDNTSLSAARWEVDTDSINMYIYQTGGSYSLSAGPEWAHVPFVEVSVF